MDDTTRYIAIGILLFSGCMLILTAVFVTIFVGGRIRRQRRGRPEGALASIILLQRSARPMSGEQFRATAEAALGVTFEAPEAGAETWFCAVGPGAKLRVGTAELTVVSADVPFVDDPAELAEKVSDPQLRAAVADHRAFLAVEVVCVDDYEQTPDAFRRAERLALALADSGTLALHIPQKQFLQAWEPKLVARLGRGKALWGLGWA